MRSRSSFKSPSGKCALKGRMVSTDDGLPDGSLCVLQCVACIAMADVMMVPARIVLAFFMVLIFLFEIVFAKISPPSTVVQPLTSLRGLSHYRSSHFEMRTVGEKLRVWLMS